MVKVNRDIWVYALLMAFLLILLQVLEFKYFVRDISLSILLFIYALFFTILGIWFGWSLNRKPAEKGGNLQIRLNQLGISNREYEVLEAIARGHSNQEIADRLYISVSTVKTHASNLFQKMNVSRRSQAINKARELGLLNES